MAEPADNPGVVARPPLLYGGALVIALALHWLQPMPILDHAIALGVGLAFIALGAGIAIAGWRALKAAATNVDPMRPTTAIVTSGPYRFSRNPLYMALTLLFVGFTLAVNTWWGIVVLVPLIVVMHYGVVRREERCRRARCEVFLYPAGLLQARPAPIDAGRDVATRG
jgi:protein-S-isoprenylcysteine O-methyltransferase Ste14